MAIIQSIKDELPVFFDNGEVDIIELGVGDGHKSYHIVKYFIEHKCEMTYYPIDISADTFQPLQKNFADLLLTNKHVSLTHYVWQVPT